MSYDYKIVFNHDIVLANKKTKKQKFLDNIIEYKVLVMIAFVITLEWFLKDEVFE